MRPTFHTEADLIDWLESLPKAADQIAELEELSHGLTDQTAMRRLVDLSSALNSLDGAITKRIPSMSAAWDALCTAYLDVLYEAVCAQGDVVARLRSAA